MSQLTCRVVRSVAAVAFITSALAAECGAAERAGAQYRILYSFKGGQDGALPAAALLTDKTGALFGSTQSGGGKNFGTVFKLRLTDQGTRRASFTASRAARAMALGSSRT